MTCNARPAGRQQSLRRLRPSEEDVGAVLGGQYAASGFTFTIQDLSPGLYDLVVYARSTVAGTFNQSRIARITVK